MEIMGVDSFLELTLKFVNNCGTSVAAADETLLSLAGISFEDPISL